LEGGGCSDGVARCVPLCVGWRFEEVTERELDENMMFCGVALIVDGIFGRV
jgi:hypothetical protein